MTAHEKILLGFEVPSGEPVYIGVHHLAIFGMTQLSGKTTALEALISRSGLRAIAFKTKRGEAGFTRYNPVTPYYRARADWQFVEGLVNVALGEKVKYEPGMRWAIIKVSKGSKNLREVKAKAEKMLASAKRQFQKQLFEKLITYLEIVVPELERWTFSSELKLQDGVNVMDLSGMRLETQQLVIASTMECAYEKLSGVVVVIPEAWEMLPQYRMTPVKWTSEQFIRKGAAIENYLWLDSQDIGGIDKTPLRQCDNWLMGRMKEAHEVERILKQLLGLKVPKEEIQMLLLGHFYASIGNRVVKVYVLPVGVPEDVGRKVARGEMKPEQVRDKYLKIKKEDEDLVYKAKFEEEHRKRKELEKKLAEQKPPEELETLRNTIMTLKDEKSELKEKADAFEKLQKALAPFLPNPIPTAIPSRDIPKSDVPSEVAVDIAQPVLTVNVHRKPLTLSQDDLLGRITIVYAENLLPPDKAFTLRHLNEVMEQRFGRKEAYANFNKVLTDLVAWGFFEKVRAGKRWDYRLKMKPEEAKEKGLLKTVEKAEA